MFAFGSGVLIGTVAGANPTPINFGLIQNCSMDDSGTLKPLFGQNRRAIAVGAGTVRTTLKATAAKISGYALGVLYYGVTPVAGYEGTTIAESGTVPAPSGPYTVTVANSADWTADQGVVAAATGLPLKRVASGPATGQYSVAAGVYTFAAADTGLVMLISYNYTVASAGQHIAVTNPLLGQTISFGVMLYGLDPTTNLGYSFKAYNAVCAKFGFATKLEDFTMPDFESELYVNAAGLLGQWNFPDKA